jgi:hypothetical protein
MFNLQFGVWKTFIDILKKKLDEYFVLNVFFDWKEPRYHRNVTITCLQFYKAMCLCTPFAIKGFPIVISKVL